MKYTKIVVSLCVTLSLGVNLLASGGDMAPEIDSSGEAIQQPQIQQPAASHNLKTRRERDELHHRANQSEQVSQANQPELQPTASASQNAASYKQRPKSYDFNSDDDNTVRPADIHSTYNAQDDCSLQLPRTIADAINDWENYPSIRKKFPVLQTWLNNQGFYEQSQYPFMQKDIKETQARLGNSLSEQAVRAARNGSEWVANVVSQTVEATVRSPREMYDTATGNNQHDQSMVLDLELMNIGETNNFDLEETETWTQWALNGFGLASGAVSGRTDDDELYLEMNHE